MDSSDFSEIHEKVKIQWENGNLTIQSAVKPYKYCLIFVQGRDMTSRPFLNTFLSPPLMELLSDFKIFCPQAPKIPPGQNHHGPKFTSWYDYKDDSSVRGAISTIQGMVRREIELLDNDPSRVFLGAFSQGCFLAVYTAMEMKEDVAGVIAVSGFLLEAPDLPQREKLPPTLIIHGLKDEIVKWNHPLYNYEKIRYRPNVKTIVIEDMKHDLDHKRARSEIYSFIRGITKGGTVKPHL